MFAKTTTFVNFALIPLVAVAVLSQGGSATPAGLKLRDGTGNVTSLAIIQPCNTTVWHVGDTQKVIWEIGEKEHDKRWGGEEEPEKNQSLPKLLLNKASAPIPWVILADDIDLDSGRAMVEVPNVITGNDYTVALATGVEVGDNSTSAPQPTVTVLATSAQFRIKKEREEKEEEGEKKKDSN